MIKLSECNGKPDCEICGGEGWVCEDHQDLPWDSWHQASCGAGQPCKCNPCHEGNLSQFEKQRLKEYDEEREPLSKFKKGG